MDNPSQENRDRARTVRSTQFFTLAGRQGTARPVQARTALPARPATDITIARGNQVGRRAEGCVARPTARAPATAAAPQVPEPVVSAALAHLVAERAPTGCGARRRQGVVVAAPVARPNGHASPDWKRRPPPRERRSVTRSLPIQLGEVSAGPAAKRGYLKRRAGASRAQHDLAHRPTADAIDAGEQLRSAR